MGAERAPYTQLDWLPDTVPTYVCAGCGAHLALQDELISKAFSGRDGKAYLFNSTLNTTMGPKEDRTLLTGVHTVCDLRCKGCSSTLGWTYLRAFESSQKYKEGKSIMEKIALVKSNNW
ncbi:yippee-like protein [Testicularia cyperi]|uniref:Protein yippee-like n=1 Tax=Testicularia cyperi TaxID=1882483 RepID=A0A317XY49_9BASI|nr:yippee-like protein [Testicularia cyperi]